ncbi:MAG: NAD(P)/FAD-dependent oxidoreductase [Coleofasciculaceae cyanobacterium]
MTVEYDLIVIGGSSAGVYTAITASHLNARVALVKPQGFQASWLSHGMLYAHALTQVGRVAQQLGDSSQFTIYSQIAQSIYHQQVSSPPLAEYQTESSFASQAHKPLITEAMQQAKLIISTCSEQNYPTVLASLGVDVITGDGEFCRKPKLGFVVNNRRLRARAYLIATGSRPGIPDIEGLQGIGYLTALDIWQQRWEAGGAGGEQSQLLQGNWLVIGGEPLGIQMAQTLVRLNCQVTLVVSDAYILSKEDSEASFLMQAQLEAEGIRVLTQSPVTQVKLIDDKKWVQAGSQAIEADEILLATGQQPNIESLNLEGVGVKFNRRGLELNQKLQTTHPRIYACGDVAGGYQFAHLAEYEASIALKNALFLPWFKVDYRGIPWAIFTDPQLARVGLTENQARRRYSKEVFVVRQYFKTLDKAQLLGETTGFCKLVTRQNGEILGATIVGCQASELIGVIALAIRQNIKVSTLADLPLPSPSLSKIIYQTALEWRRQRLRSNTTLQNFREGFFRWRRKWSS